MSSSTSKAEPPDEQKPHLFDNFQRKHPKLLSQAAINFAANVFSATFGLFNVVIFTRLLSAADFGTYALGLGFSAIVSTFMCSWLRLYIMRVEPRGDGTDVRAAVVPGLMLSCAIAPFAYIAARLAGLQAEASLATVALAMGLGFYETTLELLRARFEAFTVMRVTALRAVSILTFGIILSFVIRSGVTLLVSSMLAYVLVAIVFTGRTWSGAKINFNGGLLINLAKAGFPLTLSLTLASISATVDRFIVAHLSGAAAAGQYSAGVDLVRQTLIIPAISIAATFMPMAVQILANRGPNATRDHLRECFELVLAITLPAALGFAIVSHHIANVILGPDFRDLATMVMPIICLAVIFQILTYQYVHIGFLLSDRNSLYLINTASTMIFNCILAYGLIVTFGPVGAAWGRLAAEIFGFLGAVILTQWAFPVPLPWGRAIRVLIAGLVMVAIVKMLDGVLNVSSRAALVILIPIGAATYFAMCWVLDIAKARQRLIRAVEMLQGALAAKSGA
jgi:O-antigen/teichoic acid export membrane protein